VPTVAALTKPLVVAAALALTALVLVPPLVGRGLELPGGLEFLGDGGPAAESQSAAQISSGEFASIDAGVTPGRLRALVGDPASRNATEVEGLEVECWYYGVAGSTGAYQLCFENGRLSTKVRYSRG